VVFQQIMPDTDYNYSYFPILLENEEVLKHLVKQLEASGIHTRRYFYPPLSKLPYAEDKHLPVTLNVASRVLCLPLYHLLKDEEIKMISEKVIHSLIKLNV
ncbi:MAG: DegT/DnrJ/EryC1/StrS family aminotransferase, partial [Bacteroidota bacterium]